MTSTNDRRNFLQAALGAVSLISVAGHNAAGQSVSASTSSSQLFPLTAADLASIVARPESFLTVYRNLGWGTGPTRFIRQQLGASFGTLTDPGCLATFASLVAFSTAPYGAYSVPPMDATLDQLLNAPALNCGHYCKLTALLSFLGYPLLIPPDTTAGAGKPTLQVLVWLGTVPLNTGFHAQLVLSNVMSNAYLLLDPSYGFALRVPYSGAYPQPNLSVIQNAAYLLQAPIDPSNLVVLSRSANSNDYVRQTMISGALGPGYIYHDALYGSEGWTTRMGQVFHGMG